MNLKEKLAAKLATLKEKDNTSLLPKAEVDLAPLPSPQVSLALESSEESNQKLETFSLKISLNPEQKRAAELAFAGKNFVLTGAAGTGKTTAAREIAKSLLKSRKLSEHNFKTEEGYVSCPSIAFVAYTRIATNNMRRALHKDPWLESILTHNVLTIHKLLEFVPIFEERLDEKGEPYKVMLFRPQRTAINPLKITHLVIEEASMVGIDLWMQLYAALLPGVQIIFIGDINQLQPVFGKPILNYALVGLPVIELTEVYRQALDSPILGNAHRVLKGEPFVPHEDAKHLTTKQGGVSPSEETVCKSFCHALLKSNPDKGYVAPIDNGGYDPELDIILSPYNKNGLGTKAINSYVSQHLGDARQAIVYEILAGVTKHYLAIGDRVLVDKQPGVIISIKHNAQYMGKAPKIASNDLTRFGVYIANRNGAASAHEELDEDAILTGYENLNVDEIPEEEKKREASHITTILLEDGEELSLAKVGDYSDQKFSLAYALTVHKAQGSEWRKVFLLIHAKQRQGLYRELIYTAITRAREQLVIVDRTNVLNKAIGIQRIKGNSLREKIEWFNSKVTLDVPVPLTK